MNWTQKIKKYFTYVITSTKRSVNQQPTMPGCEVAGLQMQLLSAERQFVPIEKLSNSCDHVINPKVLPN